MNQQPKISIIVPVYGVEQYIAKCLTSIQNQTFTDFECIVVDDGSPDNSIEIGKLTVQGDERFIFVSKPNGGLASARNFGLDQARGEYIAFIDSDDWVEPDFLELPYNEITKYKADICLFSINHVDQEGNSELVLDNQLDQYYKKNDFLLSQDTITQFAWSKLYKKEVWDKIRFNEEVITYEDVYVTFRLIYGKKMVNINKPLYNYLQRPGSLSKDIKPTYLQDRIAIKDKQIEFTKQHNLYHEYTEYIIYTYLRTFVFGCATQLSLYSHNYNQDIKILKKEINPKVFTFKNIFSVIKTRPKVGFSLLLFKVSSSTYHYFINFLLKNKTI